MFAFRKFKSISKSLLTINLYKNLFNRKNQIPRSFSMSEPQGKPEEKPSEEPVLDENGKPLSKSALKKLEQKKAKADKKAQHQVAKGPEKPIAEEEDPLKCNYGEY